jgi:hypothetical protein
MNNSETNDHSILSRFKIILTIALITIALYFLWRYIAPPGIPVEEVISRSDEYIGSTITVRGVAIGVLYESTLSECVPFSCDCNDTNANYLFIGPEKGTHSEVGSIDPTLFINALECRGDVCTMYCDRLVYKNGQTYSFTGVLTDGYFGELSLENVNLNRSMRKLSLFWLPVSQFGGQIDLK